MSTRQKVNLWSLLLVVVVIMLIGGCLVRVCDAETASSAAIKFLNAIQKEDFQYVWNNFLSYRERVEWIRRSNPKILWEKLEAEVFEKEKSKFYIFKEWGPLLKTGTLQSLEERVLNSEESVVFVQVSYPDRLSSPLIHIKLIRKIVLEVHTKGKAKFISDIFHLKAGDVLWLEDEETFIVAARRLYANQNYRDALEVLKSPATPEGRKLRGDILYKYALLSFDSSFVLNVKNIAEAIELDPGIREKWLWDGLTLASRYEEKDMNLALNQILLKMIEFYPDHPMLLGRIVRNALIQAENWICVGGSANCQGHVDMARKYGGGSSVTRDVINKMVSLERNERARLEFRGSCRQREGRFLQSIPVEALAGTPRRGQ